MKNLRLLALLLLATAGGANRLPAAEPATPPASAADQIKARLATYQDRLQLTPAQQEQLKPILEADLEWLRQWHIRLQGEHSRRDRRQLMREARGHQVTVEKQIEPLLSAAQLKTWQQIRTELRAEVKAAYQKRAAS